MLDFLASTNLADLKLISKLAEEEKIKTVIEKSFTLNGVSEVLQIVGWGQSAGELIITI